MRDKNYEQNFKHIKSRKHASLSAGLIDDIKGKKDFLQQDAVIAEILSELFAFVFTIKEHR